MILDRYTGFIVFTGGMIVSVMAVELPAELRDRIEQQVAGQSVAELGRAASELSTHYRAGSASGVRLGYSREQILGYVATRLPATYAAITAALRAVRRERPDWSPRTLLDLGAGPGAGLWAGAGVWDSLERSTAVDADPGMIELGGELAAASSHPAVRGATWICADLTRPIRLEPSELVLLSYVLGDVAEEHRATIVDRAWELTIGTLVIVEPGTPAGFSRIIQARSQLIAGGGFITAPCPHDAPCPMAGRDWCHVAVRLPRSRLHRQLKDAALGYEDEKLSYVAASRTATSRAPARIIRHPLVRPGRIQLELCTPDGLRTLTVTRADRTAFRQARKATWGDAFEPPGSSG